MDCIHLGQPAGNDFYACAKVGLTTIAWCSRCHLRQAHGRDLPDLAALPPEFVARLQENPPASTSITGQPPPPVLSNRQQRIQARQLRIDRRKKMAELQDATFVDHNLQPISLKSLYRNGSLFIVLAGPSFRNVDQSLLMRRGIVTMGVNNSPATFRPHLWLHSDAPEKFHHGIWRDPAILKFTPLPYYGRLMRIKEDGHFKLIEDRYESLPGTVFFTRNASFNPDTYLIEQTVNFGNSSKNNPRSKKHPHIINVMFSALKIPWLLGFRRVFLLGADFLMPRQGPIYSFSTDKNEGARSANNEAYLKMNVMLTDLRKRFDAAGYSVYNCTAGSGLRSFPSMSFEDAINECSRAIPQTPWDTSNWYDDIGKSKRK